MKRILMFFVVVTLLMTGCAIKPDQAGSASKAMLGTREAIVGLAQGADQLCSQGVLDQSQCDEIAKIYADAKVTYDLAADAMVIAIESGDQEGSWETYQQYHARFLDLYLQLTDLAIRFGVLPVVEKGDN